MVNLGQPYKHSLTSFERPNQPSSQALALAISSPTPSFLWECAQSAPLRCSCSAAVSRTSIEGPRRAFDERHQAAWPGPGGRRRRCLTRAGVGAGMGAGAAAAPATVTWRPPPFGTSRGGSRLGMYEGRRCRHSSCSRPAPTRSKRRRETRRRQGGRGVRAPHGARGCSGGLTRGSSASCFATACSRRWWPGSGTPPCSDAVAVLAASSDASCVICSKPRCWLRPAMPAA